MRKTAFVLLLIIAGVALATHPAYMASPARAKVAKPSEVPVPVDVIEPASPPGTDGQGGPDAQNYKWIDSDQSGGPAYSWVADPTPDSTWYGDDNYSNPHTIGFTFNYRGAAYTQIVASCNGYMEFGSYTAGSYGTTYPSSANGSNAVGVLHNDLNSTSGTGGFIHFGKYGTAPNRYFVITWDSVFQYLNTANRYQAQIVLYEGDSIKLNYKYATNWTVDPFYVGCQNAGSPSWIGLNIPYNSPAIHNSYTIKFWYAPPLNNDMAVVGYLNNPGVVRPSVPTTFSAIVHNFGLTTQNAGVKVKRRITGPSAYTYADSTVTTRSLATSARETLALACWTPPAVKGNYTVKTWTDLSGDQVRSNDTFATTIKVWTGLWEQFTNETWPPTGWAMTTTDPAFFFRGTAFSYSAPASAEWDCWNNMTGTGVLRTPKLDLTQYTDDSLFFYYFHGTSSYPNYDTLWTEISTDGGSSWTLLGTLSPFQPTFALFGYSLEGVTQVNQAYVRFTCNSNYGTYVCIDDILGPPVYQTANDVGMDIVRVPGSSVNPGATITPYCRIKNYGTASQSNIPVYCWIDSAGSRIYSQNVTITGPVASGDTAHVTFPNWTAGPSGATYALTMFTALSGDGDPVNDTSYRSVFAFSVTDTIHAPWSATTPTLDGAIAPGEWDEAVKWDASDVLNRWGSASTYPPGTVYIYSKRFQLRLLGCGHPGRPDTRRL